jgi:predicted DNA-binding mobile mystery protein A
MKEKRALQLQQLNSKMQRFATLTELVIPPTGWVKAIRISLGMSMQQLGKRLSITKQGVLDMEKRESEGAITIKSLQQIARAMDMQLVYGFVPNDGSLDALIEKRATALATQIVMRTANHMKLENQANSEERIESAIKESAASIQREMPKILWD